MREVLVAPARNGGVGVAQQLKVDFHGGEKSTSAALPTKPPQQQVWELIVKATFSGKDALRRCSTNDQKNAKRLILTYVRALFDALGVIAQHPRAAWHDSELQRVRDLLEIGKPMLGTNLQERMAKAVEAADNGENNLSKLRKEQQEARKKAASLPAPCYAVNKAARESQTS